MGKRSQRKTSWGHRFTPQATVPAVGKGASTAAQSLSLKFTETRSVGGCKKTSPKTHFYRNAAIRLWNSQSGLCCAFCLSKKTVLSSRMKGQMDTGLRHFSKLVKEGHSYENAGIRNLAQLALGRGWCLPIWDNGNGWRPWDFPESFLDNKAGPLSWQRGVLPLNHL